MPKGLSETRVAFLERHPTAPLQLEDHALAGGFLHFCHDWDYLLIDQTDPEFDCCHCVFVDPRFDPKTGKPRLAS
jgi:hypothetical protein